MIPRVLKMMIPSSGKLLLKKLEKYFLILGKLNNVLKINILPFSFLEKRIR